MSNSSKAIVIDLMTGQTATEPPLDRNAATHEAVDEFSLEGDIPGSGSMDEAIKFLANHGIPHKTYGRAHIKIGHCNLWPDKGTVCLDGQKKFKGKGLEFFLKVLEREGYYKSPK